MPVSREKAPHVKAWLGYALQMRFLALTLLLAGCSGMPENVSPVTPFDAQRYLGNWYEIARLDHSFERNMQQVTANYSLNEDGSIKVTNRGFDTKKQRWSEAEGKAKFVISDNEGYLKVSFFGPFYGSYIVFELAEDYSYSMVAGPNKDYLWILSRTPQLNPATYNSLIQKAKTLGYKTEELIRVTH